MIEAIGILALAVQDQLIAPMLFALVAMIAGIALAVLIHDRGR
jgi:hypothetical protein